MRRLFVVALAAIVCAGCAAVYGPKATAPQAPKPAGTAAVGGPKVTGEGVVFEYAGPGQSVYLAGSFNDWSASSLALSKGKDGVWRGTVPLGVGEHQYKFVVDGNWAKDPNNPATAPDGFGGENSVVSVKTSPLAPKQVKDGIKFSYKAPNASRVAVAGNFNGWSQDANLMTKDASGVFSIVLPITPGRHQYKFVVDGNWLQDPSNPETTDDGFGDLNSVIIVD